jgi:hypothetical protein
MNATFIRNLQNLTVPLTVVRMDWECVVLLMKLTQVARIVELTNTSNKENVDLE